MLTTAFNSVDELFQYVNKDNKQTEKLKHIGKHIVVDASKPVQTSHYINYNTYELIIQNYAYFLRDILKLETNIPSVHDLMLIKQVTVHMKDWFVDSDKECFLEILELYSKRS